MTDPKKKKSGNSVHQSVEPGLFERMDRLGERALRQAAVGSIVLALLLHAGGAGAAASGLYDLGLFARAIQTQIEMRLASSVDLTEIEEPEPEVEPEPEPEPEAPPEEVPLEETEPVDTTDDPVMADAPPPAAAEAGQVLTNDEEPLDLTGDGFISGTGTRFAGGVTSSTGTSGKAVRDTAARAGGMEGSKGKTTGAGGPPPVDLSQSAGLPIGANWRSCGFPPEADAEQINQAVVRVVIVVGTDGKPSSVNVLSDPGYGFARVVQRCAQRFRYPVGLDKWGKPTASATKPFLIHFTR